jgi:hypothetical protein
MAVKNTNTKRVNVKKDVRVPLQSGSTPEGVLSSFAKYPMNISDSIIDNPNNYLGATSQTFYSVISINDNFALEINGDWTFKLKSGDPIEVKRGNIRNFYTIQNIEFDSNSGNSILTFFSTREDVLPLDPFIGASGYPYASLDSYVLLNKRLENPNKRDSLLRDFTYKMNYTSDDNFSLDVSWNIDPDVKVTKLRWRSVPRVDNYSNLAFSVSTQGLYSQIPDATVVSNSGRSTLLRLTGVTAGSDILVNGVNIVQQGGGYLTAPSVLIDDTYQVGLTAAEVTATLTLLNNGRVDYIRVLDGGSGYTGASVSVIGSLSSDEAVAEAIIENGVIQDIRVTYQGHDYIGATVSILPSGTGGTGASAKANIDLYSEWVYEDSIYTEKKKTITGFKTNIPYEIQIIVSTDEYFRGLVHYTDSYTFQYEKK